MQVPGILRKLIGEDIKIDADEARLEAATVRGAATKRTMSLGDANKHILVVEDNPQIVLFVERVLREQGFRISSAGNGRRALDLLATETPDLILTDVIMDEMGGPAMARQLQDSGIDVPVVFMSGHADDRLSAVGFDVSHVNSLRKPFSPAALLDQVVEALAQQDQ